MNRGEGTEGVKGEINRKVEKTDCVVSKCGCSNSLVRQPFRSPSLPPVTSLHATSWWSHLIMSSWATLGSQDGSTRDLTILVGSQAVLFCSRKS